MENSNSQTNIKQRGENKQGCSEQEEANKDTWTNNKVGGEKM